MKPTIGKVKNYRGKIVAYRATLGAIEVDAATPTEAAETCEREVLAALHRLDSGAVCRRWNGHTLMVIPTIEGWAYWHDKLSGGFQVQYKTTREECEDTALRHLADLVWTHETDDAEFLGTLPPSLRDDQAKRIRWQRDFRRLVSEGKSWNEAHQLASSET